jgi:hypothetical protein
VAFEYFLKIDGIPGESTDKKHAGEIAVESFSWGATQSGTGGCRRRRRRGQGADPGAVRDREQLEGRPAAVSRLRHRDPRQERRAERAQGELQAARRFF